MNSSKTPPLWHTLSDQQTASEQNVTLAQGLTPPEVEARRLQYGANRLTPRKGKSALLRFLLQFHNALVYILLAAGVATAFVKGPTDALTIFGVVLINAVIGYFQEAKAENAIAALAKTLRTEAQVIREGVTLTLPAEDLVPGDVVFLQAGN